eukprot:Plantae.Rhodophyta-Rhodochaete_pulchella.ctg86215.p1 GENE.Plantae.Rhodophyta-Rhodochaete_pulchella.ctg86215~~Plantae.Rhodophyta-Rhodochaete_pulchella.ctg86215.p1  ORF type:complete len:106 (+),score=13.92 Plantae.Rhodophyta-Rhodochaete_pulchella.ctg86215:50-367(+)
MLFCPHCANLLLVEDGAEGMQFFCQTCDYTYGLQGTVTKSIITEKKTKDDVLGGKEAWKNAPQANSKCPSCGNGTAYYMQMQTRSADEPMTTYYTCTKCAKTWND